MLTEEGRYKMFLKNCINYFEERMDVDEDQPNEEAYLYSEAVRLLEKLEKTKKGE